MSFLLRLLTARTARAIRPDVTTSPTSDVNTPLSIRLPPEVRGELQRLADDLGLSLHQTVVIALRGITETDPLTVQVHLMCERLRHLARLYNLDVMAMQQLVPELTPDTLANDDLLARAFTPALVERLAAVFAVHPSWIQGKRRSSAPHEWYRYPKDPVQWAKRHGTTNVRVHWHAARGAPWLTNPAPDTMETRRRTDDEYPWHLGLIMEITSWASPIFTLVHYWSPDKMDYQRSRALARTIATELHELDVPQFGMFVTEEQFLGLESGGLLPGDVIRDRPRGSWAVADVLLLKQGLYAHEDE